MRRLSVSKWILLCLIFTQVCGAQTNGDSKVLSNNADQPTDQSGSTTELTTSSPEEGVAENSADTTVYNYKDPQISEDSGDHKPQEAEPTELEQVKLDLEIEKNTSDFYYTKDKPWSTYTPATGKIFSKVVISVPYVSPVLIWEPKLPSDCSTKVSVYYTNSIILFIDIALFNGGRKVFRRFLTDSKWEDVTFPSDLKLLTHGEVALDPSNYTLTSHFGIETVYTFDLKSDAKCTEIRFKDNTVWKYNYTYCISEGLYKVSSFYPTSITYTVKIFFGNFNLTYSETHNFKVSLSDGSYSHCFIGDKHWDQVDDQS